MKFSRPEPKEPSLGNVHLLNFEYEFKAMNPKYGGQTSVAQAAKPFTEIEGIFAVSELKISEPIRCDVDTGSDEPSGDSYDHIR